MYCFIYLIYILYALYYNYINKIYLINNNINMQTYNVEITETLSRVVTVQAVNADHARTMVEHQYQDSEIILDSNDIVDTQFDIID